MLEVIEMTSDAPVRHGVFFGSASCCGGRLCTLAAFEQATREAHLLAAHLGPGWEPRVWENLGWYYEATLTSGENVLHVHPHTTGSSTGGGWRVSGYFASFNHQWSQDDKTAEGAVIKVISAIRTEVDNLGAVLAGAQHTLLAAAPQPPAVPEEGRPQQPRQETE